MAKKLEKPIKKTRAGAKSSVVAPSSAAALDFATLFAALVRTNSHISAQTTKAVNVGLTLRNWLFGCYIHSYEQSGTDRAAYGERLLKCLAERLQAKSISRADERELRRYRQFYLLYPQIRESLTPEFIPRLPAGCLAAIRESPISNAMCL